MHVFGKAGAVFAVMLPALSASALAQEPPPPRTDVGVLTCKVLPAKEETKLREFKCTFEPTQDRPPASYEGRIGPLNENFAAAAPTEMTWQVLSDTPEVEIGALAGDYRGVMAPDSGDKAAKAYLIGGVSEAITLVPLSLTADQGTALIGAVAELELRTVKAGWP